MKYLVGGVDFINKEDLEINIIYLTVNFIFILCVSLYQHEGVRGESRAVSFEPTKAPSAKKQTKGCKAHLPSI